jgi:hypothetical protein
MKPTSPALNSPLPTTMKPMTMKPIPAFFNGNDTAPPPFAPMLSDQLELFGNTSRSSYPLLKDKPAKKSLPKTTHSRSPYSKRSQTQTRSYTSTASTTEESDLSSASSSDSDESSSTLSEDSKVPKPPGEPGHPGRGGYNLESAVNWNQKAFSKLKVSALCTMFFLFLCLPRNSPIT